MLKYMLYFVPGLRGRKNVSQEIEGIIGASVQGCTLIYRNAGAGPGGKDGLIVAALPKPKKSESAEVEKRLEYCADPQRQVWVEAKGFYVGYHVDLKPEPQDLARMEQTVGYELETDDGRKWVIPLARKVDGSTCLDQTVTWNPDGSVEKRPKRRYEALCNFAAQHFEALSGIEGDADGLTMAPDERHFNAACEALGINYHVGPYELTALEAMSVWNAAHICGYLCDFPGLAQIMLARDEGAKKNDINPEESNTNSGEPAA